MTSSSVTTLKSPSIELAGDMLVRRCVDLAGFDAGTGSLDVEYVRSILFIADHHIGELQNLAHAFIGELLRRRAGLPAPELLCPRLGVGRHRIRYFSGQCSAKLVGFMAFRPGICSSGVELEIRSSRMTPAKCKRKLQSRQKTRRWRSKRPPLLCAKRSCVDLFILTFKPCTRLRQRLPRRLPVFAK